jgi:hypothetical protein
MSNLQIPKFPQQLANVHFVMKKQLANHRCSSWCQAEVAHQERSRWVTGTDHSQQAEARCSAHAVDTLVCRCTAAAAAAAGAAAAGAAPAVVS